MWPPTPPSSSDEDEVEVVFDGINRNEDLHRHCNGSCKLLCRSPRRLRGQNRQRPTTSAPDTSNQVEGMEWVPVREINDFVQEFTTQLATAQQNGIAIAITDFMTSQVGVPLTLRMPQNAFEFAEVNRRVQRQARRVRRLRGRITESIHCAIRRLSPEQTQVALALVRLIESLCQTLRPDLNISPSNGN